MEINTNTIKIDPHDGWLNVKPTKQCVICNIYADKDLSTNVRLVEDVFWMCPNCLAKLKKLLNGDKNDSV